MLRFFFVLLVGSCSAAGCTPLEAPEGGGPADSADVDVTAPDARVDDVSRTGDVSEDVPQATDSSVGLGDTAPPGDADATAPDCTCLVKEDSCIEGRCYGGDCGATVASCPDGYSCVLSGMCRCERPLLCGVVCAGNGDCEEGHVCHPTKNVCVPKPGCLGRDQCPEDQACAAEGIVDGELENPLCIDAGAGSPGEPCDSDTHCYSGICFEGVCEQRCFRNTDCGPEECIYRPEVERRVCIQPGPEEPCGACGPTQYCHWRSGDCMESACRPSDCPPTESCKWLDDGVRCVDSPNCDPEEFEMVAADGGGVWCTTLEYCTGDEDCPDDANEKCVYVDLTGKVHLDLADVDPMGYLPMCAGTIRHP